MIEPDAIAPSFLKTKYQLPTTDIDLPKIPSVSFIKGREVITSYLPLSH
jgi:hypothetical protein